MPTVVRRVALEGLRLLPKHALSRLAGRAAALRLPAGLQRWEIGVFGRAVGVHFDEVRDPIESFRCLQEFFTRALREGARPIDPEARCLNLATAVAIVLFEGVRQLRCHCD